MMVYDNPGEAGQTVSNILGGSSLITIPGSLRTLSTGNDQEKMNDYEANRNAFLDPKSPANRKWSPIAPDAPYRHAIRDAVPGHR